MIDRFFQSRMVMYANVTANGDGNPYCTASLRDKKLHFIKSKDWILTILPLFLASLSCIIRRVNLSPVASVMALAKCSWLPCVRTPSMRTWQVFPLSRLVMVGLSRTFVSSRAGLRREM